MATRQNKKRKGVRNVINRERTVTTLTAGPESAFLIPTTTEEPGAALMSSPFPVSSSAGSGPNMQQPAFPMAPNFAPFPYNGYMPGQGFVPQHQPQHFFQPEPNLPPGQNDLEVLEKLKETIKSGQHELFQPVPQPAALASLFLGPKYVSRVPPHPEQMPVDYPQRHFDESAHHNDVPSNPANANSAASNLPEQDNRLHSQSSQAWDASRKPAPQPAGDSKIADNKSTLSPPGAVSSAPHMDARHDVSTGSAPQVSNDSAARPLDRRGNGPNISLDTTQRTAGNEKPDDASRQGPPGSQRFESRNLGRSQSDKALGHDHPSGPPPSLLPTKTASLDDIRLSRDMNWTHRNGSDDRQRHDSDRGAPINGRPHGDTRYNNNGNGGDTRGPGPSPRMHERERDKERDRERERDRDRDWERERDRDRRADYARFRDDRRIDDRARALDNRRAPSEQRQYEPRWSELHRRPEYKPSGGPPAGPPRANAPDDRNTHLDTRPQRSLGEERSINRIPDAAPARAPPDDRRPPSSEDRAVRAPVDDRRGPLPPSSDRQARDAEDRRLLPPPSPAVSDRVVRPPEDRRPPVPPPAAERQIRPLSDDRRAPVPLPANSDRQMRPPEDRRLPPPPAAVDRQSRPIDDRRAPPPASSAGDRQVRPADDRRPLPPPSIDRRPPVDDRRPPPPVDRSIRASDDRRLPPSEDRTARGPTGPPPVISRPPVEDRSIRPPPSKDDLSTRPPALLEERISRAPPSLQERIAVSSSRADDRSNHPPPVRADDRTGRPVPPLEERLSRPLQAADDRGGRPPPAEDRLARPPVLPPPTSASDRGARPVPPDDRKILLAEPARPPPLSGPSDRGGRPNDRELDRGRPPVSDRFARPPSPAVSASGRGPPPSRAVFPSPARTASVARDEPRVFRPRSPVRSPPRSDARDFRPAAEPPRDRADVRPAYRPQHDRYANDRRPDLMDTDPPSGRFNAPYRRPASPVGANSLETYGSRGRSWLPAGEAYVEDPVRRPAPPDAHGYGREWREDDRGYADDWDTRNGRTWDRPAYERDRYLEREPVPNNGWETREERERRLSGGLLPPPPLESTAAPPRSFESRPLSSRLTEKYPSEERGYGRDLERGRYPPVDAPPSTYSRVRPRSPSPPPRRSGPVDDLRPPMKRAREDYGPEYFTPAPPVSDTRAPPPADYPPRARSPVASGSAYYDSRAPPAYGSSPAGLPRERDYPDARDRPEYPAYDRRVPTARRSASPYPRYPRDDRRYGVPPRG